MNDPTMKTIFDKEERRKQNKRTPAPKRQRPKSKSGMQIIMQLLEQQS